MLELIAAALTATAACSLPADLTPAPVKPPESPRILPVTRMVLAYYWWPQQCRRDRPDGIRECEAGFGFKVHGLWPDAADGTWPQFCRAPTRLSAATVRANYCMIPSTTLLQHEWVKHGTCHWPTADAYFGDTRRIAATIALPEVGTLRTAGAIRDAFVRLNPELPRSSLFVGTDNQQWLTEVRVCLTTAYQPEACENGNIGAPDRVPVRVWPRGAATPPPTVIPAKAGTQGH